LVGDRFSHFLLIVIIVTLFCIACINPREKGKSEVQEKSRKNALFKGNWVQSNPSEGNSFKVELDVESDSIWGSYCAVSDFGNRIDCSIDNELNLKGVIKGTVAEVSFYSFFGAKNGVSKLSLKDSSLVWEITKWPIGDQVIAPKSANLVRPN